MIINIYGPSGSGKTTFIRNLLMSDSLEEFYRRHSHESSKDNLNKKKYHEEAFKIDKTYFSLPSHAAIEEIYNKTFNYKKKLIIY